MANFDGIWQIVIDYAVTISSRTLNHRHTFDVNLVDANPNPGELFTAITPTFRGGTPDTLDVVVETYLTAILEFFGNTMVVTGVSLWKIPSGGTDAQFISAYTPTADTGTNAVACNAAQQTTITLRTFAGGIMRMQFMETSYTDGLRRPFPTTSTPANDFVAELVDIDTCVVGRDDAYPLVAIALNNGQNEALARKRFRE